MQRNIVQCRSQRTQSIILSSDDDEKDQVQTQYATPNAQINDEASQTDEKSIIMSTTEQLSLTLHQVSKSALRKQPNTTMVFKHEEIDLTSPMKCSDTLTQRNYSSYTLTALNQQRLTILPEYPPMENNNQGIPLLVNVPEHQLSQQEREHRQSGVHKSSFVIMDHHASKRSFIVEQYQIYYGSIIDRFNVDLSILDYNYLRLQNSIQLFHVVHNRIIPERGSSYTNFNLNTTEFPQLLEFYLQIDVDLFYMKTCSFRGAQPKPEGIFCVTTPECRYVMKPCGTCALCYSSEQATTYPIKYSIAFNLYQKHRFVNGYESILNCPATCHTNNIIYALTCQCGSYDFIGETSGHLLQRLHSHQCHIHRCILEKLIGEKNYVPLWGVKTNEMIKKDSMRLYQHPTYCPSAIQYFLNQNTDYWIFVPMINEEANQENAHFQITSMSTIRTANNTIQRCIDTLPKPPSGYKFSKLQIMKQYEFFTMKLYQKQTNSNYSVYKAALIALLPYDTSDLFRQLVHSLFVTHTEAKLNTLGHIFRYHHHHVPLSQGVWCAKLHRPHHYQLSCTSRNYDMKSNPIIRNS